MATQIQLRRDTAADWTSNNPTLAAGEFGWESDSNRFKIGDGSAAWTSLSYADTLKTLGDILVNGSTISAPSNGDLTLTTSGTGNINLGEFIVNGTTLSSSDSSSININEGLIVDGALNVSGTATLSGATNLSSTLAVPSGLTTLSTLSVTSTTSLVGTTTIDNLTFNDNTIGSSSNADINLTPGGTGNVVAGGLTFNGTTMSAADSSSININDGLIVDGTLNVSGAATLSGLAYPTVPSEVG